MTMFRLLCISLLLSACSLFASGAPFIAPFDLQQRIQSSQNILVLDVRTATEFTKGHLPGALHIDHRDIEEHLESLSSHRNRPLVVYCSHGIRAGMVESYLIEQGFSQVMHLSGDFPAWLEAGLPVEK